MKIIRFLITGSWHEHKWVQMEKYEMLGNDTKKIIGITYILKCEICGNIKSVEA